MLEVPAKTTNNLESRVKTSLLCLLLSLLLINSMPLLAFDKGRLWLPKSHSKLMPKLAAVAYEAEQTHRCVEILAGEMIARKNTEDHYYFVIKCRDKDRRSYNLSYLYPVNGGEAELAAEQRSSKGRGNGSGKGNAATDPAAEGADAGINAPQALLLCRNELDVVADIQALEGVVVVETQISEPAEEAGGFSYSLPFNAFSEMGAAIRYRGDCTVSAAAEVAVVVTLEGAGAVALCRESLRAEAIILGRVRMEDVSAEEISSGTGESVDAFHYQLPFAATMRSGSVINYRADCRIGPERVADISIALEKAGALTICRDSLLLEALLMKAVNIADEPLSATAEGKEFFFQLAFSASDPEGNKRSFTADCQVDEEGETDVSIQIDKIALVSVCVNAVKEKTRRMLDVVVLMDRIEPLKKVEDGYSGSIPFNAKAPSGRQLRYSAQCWVDGSGRSKISLGARKD